GRESDSGAEELRSPVVLLSYSAHPARLNRGVRRGRTVLYATIQKHGAQNGTESAPHLFRHHTRSIRAVVCQSESRGHRSQRQQRDRLEIRRRSAMELLTRNAAAYSALSAHSNVHKRSNRLRKTAVPRRTEHLENRNLRIVVLRSPYPGLRSRPSQSQ